MSSERGRWEPLVAGRVQRWSLVARGEIPDLNIVAFEIPNRRLHCFRPQLPQIYAADDGADLTSKYGGSKEMR